MVISFHTIKNHSSAVAGTMLLAAFTVCSFFCSCSTGLAGFSNGNIPLVLRVPLFQSKVLRVDGLRRVSLTNSSIADVVVASPSEVIVNGKSIGKTMLHLWDSKGRVDLPLVILRDVSSIPAMLKRDLKGISDTVDIAVIERDGRETLVLRGLVDNNLQVEIVEEMARSYTEGEIINLIEVREIALTTAAIEDKIRLLIKEPEVTVSVVTRGSEITPQDEPFEVSSIILEGFVDDQYDKDRLEAICGSFVSDSSRLTNLVDVVNPVEILVEGAVLELASEDTESLGVEWGTAENTTYDDGVLAMGARSAHSARFLENLFSNPHGDVSYLGPKVDESHNWPWSFDNLNRVDPLYSKINFNLQNNKARVLARPKVVTRVGTLANLRVGGELPLVGERQYGGNNVEYHPYGLDMKITPDIDHQGNITTVFDLSWTTVDFASAQMRDGATYYGLKKRATSSEVTVRDGQHIIISGLVTEDKARVSSGIPLLSKIPVIGKLFETNDYIDRKTELVVVLTPSLYSSKNIREKYKRFEDLTNSRGFGAFVPGAITPVDGRIGQEQLQSLNVALKAVDRTFSSIMKRDDITLTPVTVPPVDLIAQSDGKSSLCNMIASASFSGEEEVSTVSSPPVSDIQLEDAPIQSVVDAKIDSLMGRIESSLSNFMK